MVKRLGCCVVLVLAMVFFVPAAKADSLAFNSNNSVGSSWGLAGSPISFQLSSSLSSVQLGAAPPNTAIANGTIGWTTGAASTDLPDLIIFSPGGTITVTGDLGDGLGPVNLFTGSFQSASLTLLSGGAPAQSSFSASFVSGDVNSALYTFLGASGLATGVTGTLTATLNGTFTANAGGGSVAGATISLDPVSVPEPTSVVLLGSGLLTLAVLTTMRSPKLAWRG